MPCGLLMLRCQLGRRPLEVTGMGFRVCIAPAAGNDVGWPHPAAVAGEAEVASSVLATVGELAAVAGPALRPHMAGAPSKEAPEGRNFGVSCSAWLTGAPF